MKRRSYITIIILVIVFGLAACSNNSQSKSSSSSTSDTTSQKSDNKKKDSSSHEVKKVSGTKAVQFKSRDYSTGSSSTSGTDATITETVTYDGDEYKTIKMVIAQSLPDDIKGRDINDVRGALPELEKSNTIQDLKKVKGVTVNLEVTDDYQLKYNITYDMKSLDKSALNNTIAPLYFDELQKVTPLEYVLLLFKEGGTSVKPS
ncbi:SP0191 family lipoprotein [Streptococcus dentapri]|uniref:SP0191 family lipoprotein n=1 Tax=Streptococcus dentapri TaxID=573564 RepID=A0ABV8D2E2_9STRE